MELLVKFSLILLLGFTIEGAVVSSPQCGAKKISCLNSNSFRLCEVKEGKVLLFGDAIYCKPGYVCHPDEGVFACVSNDNVPVVTDEPVTFSTTTTTTKAPIIPETPECSSETKGNHPYYESNGQVSCSQYYECSRNLLLQYKLSLKTCGKNKGYSVEEAKCVSKQC